jgi:Caspase domain
MSPGKPELYALLIGVDCYLPNQLPGGYYYASLGGCVRDIKHVETFLLSRLGMTQERILKLTASRGDGQKPLEPLEQWPTYENMVAKFKQLLAVANAGDQVYIHYSGHGGRALTAYKSLKGDDGLDEALVPTDIGNSEARYLRDVELAYLLKSMVDKVLIVTVVLDSCHSGGATRGIGKATPRSMMPDGSGFDTTPDRPTHSDVASAEDLEAAWMGLAGRTRTAKPDSGWLAEPKGYTLLAACRANESAYEDYFGGTEKNGALTYWLLDTLKSSGPGMSYEMLYQRMLGRIRSWMVEQTPQLQGEGGRVVFGTERINPHYSIPVMQFDKVRNRIALNAGESHGLRQGDLFAVYPLESQDHESKEGRQAIAEISEVVGDSDSWATITEKFGDEDIEQGAQAVLMGSTNLRLQRTVGLALEDPSLKRAMEASISEGGAGFVRLAGQDEAVDLQVAIDESGECYDVWDRKGTALPNLRPLIKTTEANAAERVTKRLVHLAKYLNVQALNNPDPAMSQKLRVELIGSPSGGESGRTPTYLPGTKISLRVHNTLQPNPHDIDDPTRILNVTVLDLQSDWGITQIFPAGAGASDIVQPGKSIELAFETYLPDGYDEATDVMKVFATQKTTSFRWLELPALDQPSVPRAVTRGIGSDPLEQLMSAFTEDMAPSQEEMRIRAVKLLSVSGTEKTWAVAQVEICVKKA